MKVKFTKLAVIHYGARIRFSTAVYMNLFLYTHRKLTETNPLFAIYQVQQWF